MLTAAAGLLTLETIMLAVHALGLEIGPAITNAILIAMTVPVMWFRGREVR